jgi:predicted nucleic acid-binding protein
VIDVVCLDTDVLVSLLREDPQTKKYVEGLESRGETAYTTPVNTLALFLGG